MTSRLDPIFVISISNLAWLDQFNILITSPTTPSPHPHWQIPAGPSSQVLVFMLCTCAYVPVSYVCLCSCCVHLMLKSIDQSGNSNGSKMFPWLYGSLVARLWLACNICGSCGLLQATFPWFCHLTPCLSYLKDVITPFCGSWGFVCVLVFMLCACACVHVAR